MGTTDMMTGLEQYNTLLCVNTTMDLTEKDIVASA